MKTLGSSDKKSPWIKNCVSDKMLYPQIMNELINFKKQQKKKTEKKVALQRCQSYVWFENI